MINGEDMSSLLFRNTLSIEDSTGERSTAEFELFDAEGTTNLNVGLPVQIYDKNDNLVFAGITENPLEETVPGTEALRINVSCVDNTAKADRHLVARTYTDTLAGDIVRQILADKLADEGVTEGVIIDGPTVISAVFPYVPASQVFDELAEQSGYVWNITHDNELYFVPTDFFKSPWNITGFSDIKNVAVRTSKERYRNRQYIRAGQDITDVLTERFRGDGERQTFTVGFKIAKKPTLFLNNVEIDGNDVGIRGLDDDKAWYWSKDEKEITQHRGAAPIGEEDTLRVDYRGFYPIIVVSDEPSAIDERKRVEGGTGVYEYIESKPSINDRNAALDLARGKLRKYARVQRRLIFETTRPGLRAGQIINVDLPKHSAVGDFLIEEVRVFQYKPNELRYTIKAVDGEPVGGWAHFFRSIARQGEDLTIRDNEVLVLLNNINERTGLVEYTQTTTFSCPVISEELTVRDDVIIC